MSYQKPTIALLGDASRAIQGMGVKTIHRAPDALNALDPNSTGSAYDLDE